MSRLTRRRFLGAATVMLPTVPLLATGVANANRPPELPVRRLALGDIADDLVGLRVLQISDVHLGFERSVADVERFVRMMKARRERIDLLALTGDIADDPNALEPALHALLGLEPRFGAFACAGNHEHFGDMRRVVRAFASAGIPLLDGEGKLVRVGRCAVWVAGVDDPVVTHGRIPLGYADRLRPFYEGAITRALAGNVTDAPTVLLCHRPEGFDVARERGVRVILSGHTHGGHVGFRDRSVLERVKPNLRVWGTYGDAQSRLHVTSGFGHWFQFRLGCPTEAPLLELVRA